MRDIIHALTCGFSRLLKWQTMKYALITGIISIAIWSALGYILWDQLVYVSQKILELLPFSMLRSNGAWMISMFIWFQLVLVTYAVIYALFGNLILQKIKRDKFASVSLSIVILSALFWAGVWHYESAYIHKEILRFLTWLPFETLESSMAFLIVLYFLYNGAIVTMLFFSSIFAYPYIESIYEDVSKKHIFKSISYTIKDSVIFLILSLLLIAVLFIPILNILVQIVLWTWLVKDTVSHDALYLSQIGENEMILKDHKMAIYMISIVGVLFNFVPILNIVGPFFTQISMFEYFRQKRKS